MGVEAVFARREDNSVRGADGPGFKELILLPPPRETELVSYYDK